MPRWVEIAPGQRLQAPQDVPAEMLDAAADEYETTGKLPQGFTLDRDAGGGPMEAIKGALTGARDYATQGAARTLTAAQTIMNLPRSIMEAAGGQEQTFSPEYRQESGQAMAEALVPQSPTQALLMAALGAHGVASPAATNLKQVLSQAAQRSGLAIGAGAAGAALEGESPVSGAVGMWPVVAGEAAMAAIPAGQALVKSLRGPGAASPADLQSLQQALQQDFPAPGQPIPGYHQTGQPPTSIAAGQGTANDLYDLSQRRLIQEAGKQLEAGEAMIVGMARKNAAGEWAKRMPGSIDLDIKGPGTLPTSSYARRHIVPKVNVPALNTFAGKSPDAMMPLDEALALKKELGKVAFPNRPSHVPPSDLKYDPIQLYDQARHELGGAIDEVGGPQARQLYDFVNEQYSKSVRFKEFMTGGRTPQGTALTAAFPKQDTLDMSALQGERYGTYYNTLIGEGKTPETADFKALMDAITRGGGPTAKDRFFQMPVIRAFSPTTGAGTTFAPPAGVGLHTYAGRGTPVPTESVTAPLGSSTLDYLLWLASQQE